MGILKGTHLKAVEEEDEEKRNVKGKPEAFIFELLLARLKVWMQNLTRIILVESKRNSARNCRRIRHR
jgi:ribonucleotide monophosphatase NagD (HAD superfamily)